jgi:hypothetical protein
MGGISLPRKGHPSIRLPFCNNASLAEIGALSSGRSRQTGASPCYHDTFPTLSVGFRSEAVNLRSRLKHGAIYALEAPYQGFGILKPDQILEYVQFGGQ